MNPKWSYLSGDFDINSIGSLIQDPNDPTGNTILVGTGEGNAGFDSIYGVGIYRSTDGGDTWSGLIGSSVFSGRAVATIAIKPGDSNTLYAGTTRAFHGLSSVEGGEVSIRIPGAAIWGLYKSTDGGTIWNLIHNGAGTTTGCTDPATVASNVTACSPFGVPKVLIDPADSNVIYSASFGRGIWRSPDEGTTWVQIKAPFAGTGVIESRAELAVAVLPNGNTRMYAGEGASGQLFSRFFRSDNVRTGSPVFTDLTSSNPADPGYGSFDYCGTQCWYDNLVYTPPGNPDMVYLGGSYQYDENDPFPPVPWISNGRGVVQSMDAGVSFTDLSYDSKDFVHPNGLHPDHHAMVTNPNNPLQFFETNDGGVFRSSGKLEDISAFCDSHTGLNPTELARCQQLLSAVPSKIESIGKGLSTLQFMSLSVNPHNPRDLQGGTQDNGTWESYGNPIKWINTMIGDGGQSGFDVTNKKFRFHTFTAAAIDVNLSKGEIADWNWIADPLFISGEGAAASFYTPVISDPSVSGTMFVGLFNVWRTKTQGLGSMTVSEFRQHCNEWTGDFSVLCGDWEPLGSTDLTDPSFGDREGFFVASVERAPGDDSTLWAATGTGRVFISKNADADPASAVSFTRIDTLSTVDPGRFVSGIFVDPADPNHAWISYSGFSASTPAEPGHIFSVNYDPAGGTATWTSLDGTGPGSIGDIPINDVVFDSEAGDLYVSTDFGVLQEDSSPGINWTDAAPGLPHVQIPGLTIAASDRRLYAATHGLGAWLLKLR